MILRIDSAVSFNMAFQIPYTYYEKTDNLKLYEYFNNLSKGEVLYPLDDPGTPNSIFAKRIFHQLYKMLVTVKQEFDIDFTIISSITNIDKYSLYLIEKLNLQLNIMDKNSYHNIYNKNFYPYNEMEISLKNGTSIDILHYYLKKNSIRELDEDFSNLYLGHAFYNMRKYKLAKYRYSKGLECKNNKIKFKSYIGIINCSIKERDIKLAKQYLRNIFKYTRLYSKNYQNWLLNLYSYILLIEGKKSEAHSILENIGNKEKGRINSVIKKNKLHLEYKLSKIDSVYYINKLKDIIKDRPYDDDLKIDYLKLYYELYGKLDNTIVVNFYHEEYNYLLFKLLCEYEIDFAEIENIMAYSIDDYELIKYANYLLNKDITNKKFIFYCIKKYISNNNTSPLIVKYIYIYFKHLKESFAFFVSLIQNDDSEIVFYVLMYLKRFDFSLFRTIDISNYHFTKEQLSYLID